MQPWQSSATAVSGASAGYFSGWAVALLRRYRNFDTGENAN